MGQGTWPMKNAVKVVAGKAEREFAKKIARVRIG
jgi:hypothetical protein